MIEIRSRNGQAVTSLEEWRLWCRPQTDKDWKDGKSAKECARAWFRSGQPAVPAELAALFDAHPLTRGLDVQEVIPEFRTPLDNYGRGRGAGRNHDVVARGHTPTMQVVVCVEAKVDEPFGSRTIGAEYDHSRLKPGSRIWQRIEQLVQSVFGRALDDDIRALRYQLLHSIAGTLIQTTYEPTPTDLAVFVVHAFEGEGHNARANRANWAAFVAALTGIPVAAVPSTDFLIGPIRVPGSERLPASMPLLIGKTSV